MLCNPHTMRHQYNSALFMSKKIQFDSRKSQENRYKNVSSGRTTKSCLNVFILKVYLKLKIHSRYRFYNKTTNTHYMLKLFV